MDSPMAFTLKYYSSGHKFPPVPLPHASATGARMGDAYINFAITLAFQLRKEQCSLSSLLPLVLNPLPPRSKIKNNENGHFLSRFQCCRGSLRRGQKSEFPILDESGFLVRERFIFHSCKSLQRELSPSGLGELTGSEPAHIP